MRIILLREELLEGIFNAIGVAASQEVYELIRLHLQSLTAEERDPPGRVFVRDAVLISLHHLPQAILSIL